MKDTWEKERDQWIPWEISYSLRNKKRSDNKSKRNAILLVILPDVNGSYNYVNNKDFYFEIIKKNLNNLNHNYPATKLQEGCSQSYMLRCSWEQFLSNINGWIEAAIEIKQNADKYKITSKLSFY